MSNQRTQLSSLSLKLISINAKGLNISEKEHNFAKHVHNSRKVNIVCIQENTFQIVQISKIQKFKDDRFPLAYHATSPNLKTNKDVTILISKQTPFQLTDSMCDPLGRYIYLKGKIVPTLSQLQTFMLLTRNKLHSSDK